MYAELLVTGRRPGSSGKIAMRSSPDGHAVMMDGHARYQQAVYDGNVFIGSNLGGTPVTTQAGLSATTPALTIYNPVGSGKIGVLIEFGYSFAAAPAAASQVLLAYNLLNATAPTLTTLANVVNARFSSALPVLQCARVATLSAAPLALVYVGGTTGAAAISGYNTVYDCAGGILIPPGLCLSVQTIGAASLTAHFKWEEINI